MLPARNTPVASAFASGVTADRHLDTASREATQGKQSGGFLIQKKAPKPLICWAFRVPKRPETLRSVAGGVAIFIFDVVSARYQDKSGTWREKRQKIITCHIGRDYGILQTNQGKDIFIIIVPDMSGTAIKNK